MDKESVLSLLMRRLHLVEIVVLGAGLVQLFLVATQWKDLIDSGEDWMLPLLEFREILMETQVPERKADVREHRRR